MWNIDQRQALYDKLYTSHEIMNREAATTVLASWKMMVVMRLVVVTLGSFDPAKEIDIYGCCYRHDRSMMGSHSHTSRDRHD